MRQFENLIQKEKIIIAIVYIFIIALVFHIISGGLFNFLFIDDNDAKICFLTGAFLLLMGNYIVEPYFTKPSDAIVNSSAVILALLGLNDSSKFMYYPFALLFSTTVLIIGILAIILKDIKVGKVFYYIVELLGKSKVIFSIVFVLGIYSYYGLTDKVVDFIVLLVLWVVMVFSHIIEHIYLWIKKLIDVTKSKVCVFGTALGCDNTLLYTFEHANNKGTLPYSSLVTINNGKGAMNIGMVIHSKPSMSKTVVDTCLISDNGKAIEVHKDEFKNKSIINNEYSVSTACISDFSSKIQEKIKCCPMFINSSEFIGFVISGSDINKIKVAIIRDDIEVVEGMIFESSIYGKKTLYQLINGITDKESFDKNNNHGYHIGIARKLGTYIKEDAELNISRWVPMMYEPVFIRRSGELSDKELKEIADTAIGRLPNTEYKIPIKDINSLVTHNIAILGILGIGKSCLSFELISKIVANDIKVICIDITNQYVDENKGLPKYIGKDQIEVGLPKDSIDTLKKTKNNKGLKTEYSKWGNVKEYRLELNKSLKTFLDGENSVMIYNPDWHPVTQGASKWNIEEHADLTITEKTRVISEQIFIQLRAMGESDKARVLLVYEEAHSLIPEWNSVANDGDKAATNGTSKVILQGRKYGLGCLAITQRTANISKSILNQCNTIFALRIFDDTGKNFLENYIGSDYSSTLPTLEERHVIAIGKGLKLKQPVIIQLNHKKFVTRS
ncbi:ATP-binding protein [Vallitalea guaymasensis]|uniref:ATP-binding protein n=1 Tax=Vallitalea guaymasensis TaxID=1185412 RepID=UPI000DE28622|nr:DUF87 domain-containing protein [Vallitalea guaymasensis]